MAFFYGEHDLTIDEKNRLLIPAEVRRMLDAESEEKAFFLLMGINRVPWLYPEKYYIQMANQRRPTMIPLDAQLEYGLVSYGMIVRLEWDRQGRVVIPDKTMKRIQLQRDLTLVGNGDHLQLWNRDAWETAYADLDRRRPQIAASARDLGPAAPG